MDSARHELEKKFTEFRSIAAPRIGAVVEVEDADVDLFEEESFVAGLVDRFLKTGSVGPYKAVELESSIDERLRRALKRQPDAGHPIRVLQEYRQHLVSLAEALGRATGISVKWTSGPC